MNRKKELEVPASAIAEVAGLIAEHGLTATIMGPHDEIDDAILIEVEYSTDEREAVHELEDFIEDQWEEIDEDDEDEDDY